MSSPNTKRSRASLSTKLNASLVPPKSYKLVSCVFHVYWLSHPRVGNLLPRHRSPNTPSNAFLQGEKRMAVFQKLVASDKCGEYIVLGCQSVHHEIFNVLGERKLLKFELFQHVCRQVNWLVRTGHMCCVTVYQRSPQNWCRCSHNIMFVQTSLISHSQHHSQLN